VTIHECYLVLELEPGTAWEDVRNAHKLLATVWHPDRFTGNPTLHAQAEQKLKRINEAYQTLKQRYEQGGAADDLDAGELPESGAGDAFIDRQCQYLGSDPRLRALSPLEFGCRAAMVRVGEEGITVATVRGGVVDEIAHYPAGTIR
jgi:hypothetical protein